MKRTVDTSDRRLASINAYRVRLLARKLALLGVRPSHFIAKTVCELELERLEDEWISASQTAAEEFFRREDNA